MRVAANRNTASALDPRLLGLADALPRQQRRQIRHIGASASGHVDDFPRGAFHGDFHVRGPHHEPVAVILHMEQRYGFEQGIAHGDGLDRLKAGGSQRVADKRLLHQVKDDDHVASRTQFGGRPFDLHGKPRFPQYPFGPDDLARMLENEKAVFRGCAGRRGSPFPGLRLKHFG